MQRRSFSSPNREDSREIFSQEVFAQSGVAAVASTRAAAIACGATMAIPVTRILTLHPNNLSDFVLSLPVLLALRESFPGARICGAMRPALASLLHNSPLVDDVLPRAPGGLSQQTALMLQLRAQHFDIAVALSPSRSTTLLAWSSAASTRVGFSVAKMEALLTHRIESAPPFAVEDYLELTRAVGCAAHRHDSSGSISLSPAVQMSAARVLEKHGIRGDFLIAAPVAASSPRGEEASGASLSAVTRGSRRRAILAARRAAQNVEAPPREYSPRDWNDETRFARNENRDDLRNHEDVIFSVEQKPDNIEESAPREYSRGVFVDEASTNNVDSRHETQQEAAHDALLAARRAGEKAWRGAMEFASSPAARELKEWPAGHWARALDELSSRAPIVLIGNAPSPIPPLMKNRVLDLGGALDLPTMAALCNSARLFLGTDSGLMHLAAAQETPVLALLNVADAARWDARAASTRVLFFGSEGAAFLAPEEVVQAARELIGL